MAHKKSKSASHRKDVEFDASIVIRKLETFGNISAQERDALLGIIERPHVVKAGSDIVADGSAPKYSMCLIDGFACRYKFLSNDRRQIMSLHYGGDITGYILNRMDHAIGAITNCTVATMSHDSIRKVTSQFPNLASVIWRDTHMESALLRTWIINLGRKTALSRVAHFFCEQFTRLKSVGLTTENAAALGVTQSEIADALGLSMVHTNRILQELRQTKLMDFRSKTLTIIDWKQLQTLAEFDASYLQLRRA